MHVLVNIVNNRTIILPRVLYGCETWLLIYMGVSVNACYHSVQNILSSTWLSKNSKIKIYRIITPPFV